jgi:hypothetical protein
VLRTERVALDSAVFALVQLDQVLNDQIMVAYQIMMERMFVIMIVDCFGVLLYQLTVCLGFHLRLGYFMIMRCCSRLMLLFDLISFG